MVLGLIGASMMMSKVGFIRRLAVAYSTVIRGVPDLVWMLLIYYGAQILINDWADRLEVVPIELNPARTYASAPPSCIKSHWQLGFSADQATAW